MSDDEEEFGEDWDAEMGIKDRCKKILFFFSFCFFFYLKLL